MSFIIRLFKYFGSGIVIGPVPFVPPTTFIDNTNLGCPIAYDLSDNTLKAGINGAWVSLGEGGGGGGGSLQWVEDSTVGPVAVASIENNMEVYAFVNAADDGSNLMTMIKVPSSYKPGAPIKMLLDFYSPDSTGNALMQTLATLIRQGTDPMSDTTNQHTSTNAAVTLSGGTVDIPQALSLDLTDSSGEINSVAVNPGDFIKVQLFRGTDTGLNDLKVPVFGAEVTIK